MKKVGILMIMSGAVVAAVIYFFAFYIPEWAGENSDHLNGAVPTHIEYTIITSIFVRRYAVLGWAAVILCLWSGIAKVRAK
jgi:hypothetical protein